MALAQTVIPKRARGFDLKHAGLSFRTGSGRRESIGAAARNGLAEPAPGSARWSTTRGAASSCVR